MNTNVLHISKKEMESFGSLTLEGMIGSRGWTPDVPIELEFEETSLSERRQRGGAEEILVPEYFPASLVRSMLNLQKMGFQIMLKEVE